MQGVLAVHSKRGECSLKSVLNIVLVSVSYKTPPTSLGRGALELCRVSVWPIKMDRGLVGTQAEAC